jgi:hypothetical protein
MKKRKRLEKKIQRLRKRLAKDNKKLAKLTSKLKLAVATGAEGAKKVHRQSAGGTKSARRSPSTAEAQKLQEKKTVRPAKKQAPPKQKKKTNISPERRAQLAAAMKARWATKRAAAAQATRSTSQLPREASKS